MAEVNEKGQKILLGIIITWKSCKIFYPLTSAELYATKSTNENDRNC